MRTSEIKHLLICLLVICGYLWLFFENCLFSYSDLLKNWDVCFFYWYIELLNIFCEKTPLSSVFWTNVCSVACLLTLSSGFFNKQKFFISCDWIYQFFSLLLLLLIPCLGNGYEKVIKIFCYVYVDIFFNIVDLTSYI